MTKMKNIQTRERKATDTNERISKSTDRNSQIANKVMKVAKQIVACHKIRKRHSGHTFELLNKYFLNSADCTMSGGIKYFHFNLFATLRKICKVNSRNA